ncbi:ABC transporter substrate-binding protein [Amycolatopsis carbonis]|uniref:ABC transporter substrate-binding protein n=1 Tax=Amycolatopsis carbonis TaxID=715471 RepID=A0A9Y2IAG5_9PSEU|nr:ABC transporter substrate-binding protein [Amycolatopsis sp. 2-15]WIX75525.1 ABC transporter substrate-binding protein [Amycolatopsis sp. 2-15]
MIRFRRGRVVASALAVLAVGVGSACSAPGGSSNSSASTSGPIKMAVVNAQSGQLSSLGAWEYKGAKLAVDQWNANGGINGRKIQLDVFDDTGDPTTGTNLARKIASEGYVAMIGTAESAVTVAMAPVLQQAKIPSITSGQSPSITAVKSPFQFLNGPTSTTYDETLAKYLVDQKNLKNIAFISNNGSYGKGEHDAFGKALADRGIKPVDDQVVTTDQKDFSAALTSIRQKNPQVLFVGTEEVEAGLIVKQARELGLSATVAGAAPMGTTVYLQTAGAANAEGTVVSSPYLSNDTSDASRSFAQAYKAAYNEEAELHGAKSFDGTNIFLTAMKNSNAATGQALADAIRSTKYPGLLGTFTFDETGVGIHATSIGVITSGKLIATATS